MNFNPSPFIITDFTMVKNHFAGTMLERMRKGKGMFSMGNIKPLSINVGKNIPVSAINIAVCCESVNAEISNPNDKQVIVNKILSLISNNRLPLIGTPNANTLSSKMLMIFMIDNNK